MIRTGYHTQENRGKKLTEPINCAKDNAWFGEALYYWESIEDADYWGVVSKKKTGRYDVYSSQINCEEYLDTVFNEAHYRSWLKAIEGLAVKFRLELQEELTLKALNDYLKDKGLYSNVDGVIFQDISNKDEHYLVKGLQYKKRIQLAVFNNTTIKDFVFLHTGKIRSYGRFK